MLKAIIFDMDGVLVDSEPFILEAATQMLAEHGLTAQQEDFKPFVGAGEDRFVGGPAEKYGLTLDIPAAKARTYAIYDEITRGHLEPLSGVRDFIAAARAMGLRLAVASSADRIKIGINLREIGIDPGSFDAIVSGEDVENKKPSPDIFLVAAERLGALPAECIVVEDAVTGVAAAKAAGMRCLALTTSFTPDQLAGADWIARDLSSVTPDAFSKAA